MKPSNPSTTTAPLETAWLQHLTQPARILLVEDDAKVRDVFSQLFTEFNCILFEAEDGEKAVHLIQNHSFDLIFLDLQLPKIDGIDVFKEVKKHRPTTPVMVISGFLDENVINAINKIGFACFVRKPFDFNRRFVSDLLSTVQVRRRDTLPGRDAEHPFHCSQGNLCPFQQEHR